MARPEVGEFVENGRSTGNPQFELPKCGFPMRSGQTALCRVARMPSGRTFGNFEEKTLECNQAAKDAIDELCYRGGFTQSWASIPTSDGFLAMEKIPVIILVKLMLGLPAEAEDAVQSLRGAYPISMNPEVRTCMNVIVGRRRSKSGGYVMDKFSLYWPDNAAMESRWGMQWPLLQGYAFRTAVLNGTLNRASLNSLARGTVSTAKGTKFDRRDHGLIIDGDSAYEDCAYMQEVADETDDERSNRIEKMIKAMEVSLVDTLSLSYDPEEKDKGITALRSEWLLLKKHGESVTQIAKEEANATEFGVRDVSDLCNLPLLDDKKVNEDYELDVDGCEA